MGFCDICIIFGPIIDCVVWECGNFCFWMGGEYVWGRRREERGESNF